jgi:bla regulator protein BlaR1
VINLPLIGLFQIAYAPSDEAGFLRGNLIAGAPDWLNGGERYDVIARVGEEDLAQWQSSPSRQNAMMRTMLRSLLAERMKAVVHHEAKEVSVYDLVVGKNGPKFKVAETVGEELKAKHPGGSVAPGGGMIAWTDNPTVVQLYAVPMTMLAGVLLSNVVGKPVIDNTGLTGRYDLAIQLPAPDGGESIFTAVQEQLGLKLEPGKGTVETLLIDHVERPSEN